MWQLLNYKGIDVVDRSLLYLSQKGASSVKNALERQKRPPGVYQSFMFLKVCLSRVQLLVD